MTGPSSHRRQNLLTGGWVLVSPHRMGRPWSGETAPPVPADGPVHDPDCPLCPGTLRAGGARNPGYRGVHVFANDFPALSPDLPDAAASADPLLVAEPETGICRVLCYSPDHSRTMARMGADEVEAIVETWRDQWIELSADPRIGAVTIFENRGAMMGASSPHPHGQVWATSSVPDELAREVARQADWLERHGRPMLMDYAAREIETGERVVFANRSFLVVVPWWAAWPFETLILPLRAVADLEALTPAERVDLAEALRVLSAGSDRLFSAPFPCTLGLHQRPVRTPAPGFVMHLHVYPPLLRSASVRKHMVGFEMLAMPQRDITPEGAAARLRAAIGGG